MTDRLQHHQVVPQTLGLACSYGVLFQQGALLSSLTVQENVALPLIEQAHLRRPEAEHLARLKLAMVGLAPDAATKYPSELSGGMIKQIGRASCRERVEKWVGDGGGKEHEEKKR